MSKYVIITDSACDLELKTLNEWNVKCLDLSLTFIDDGIELLNSQINAKSFYQRMREGGVAKTSAVNVERFKQLFKEELEKGNNILYVGFSSALSTTYNSGAIAAKELMEEFPNKEIITFDSLAASVGQGMLVYLACQKRDEGVSLKENALYLEEIKGNICHWFTVSDLVYLKRGGRISPTIAFVGGLLGIKPILHVDDGGHLVSSFNVRGRKSSIKAIVKKYGELVKEKGMGPVYICHADCENDVQLMKDELMKNYDVKVDVVVNTGPVIGAHSGPGTIALFFIGKER